MPSFQRLLVLAVLGVSFFAHAAVVPSAESTDVGAANENEITPDFVTQAFAKTKSTAKKTTAKATPKKTTAKPKPKKTTSPKKTTAKATPTVKKTTAKATPTVKKTTAKTAPTVKKTTSKAAPTAKKTTTSKAVSKKTAAPKSTKAKPTAKPTSVKKTSAKPKATAKPKSTTKPTGTKVSSAKPSSTGGASCPIKPKGGKKTREHSFEARSNLVDLNGKEGRKGARLGGSLDAEVFALSEWDGRAVTDLAIKFTEEAVSAEEVGNLKACQRYTYGPNIDCKGGMSAIVMHKGQGTVLDSVAGWKANKQALLPIIAQQTAAMAVDWMHKYGRMHTDLHPGNIMVTGSGTSLTVVDLVDLGVMLQANGQGTKGRGAFASWNTDANALAQTLQTDYLLK